MKTIAQQLNITYFPFTIKDKNGNQTYFENSNGYWFKREFDSNGKEIYFENSDGDILDNRPKKHVTLTIKEIADKLGVDVKTLQIKD